MMSEPNKVLSFYCIEGSVMISYDVTPNRIFRNGECIFEGWVNILQLTNGTRAFCQLYSKQGEIFFFCTASPIFILPKYENSIIA